MTNLTDAGLLNAALAAASLPALDVSALPAPEPATLTITAPLAFGAVASSIACAARAAEKNDD